MKTLLKFYFWICELKYHFPNSNSNILLFYWNFEFLYSGLKCHIKIGPFHVFPKWAKHFRNFQLTTITFLNFKGQIEINLSTKLADLIYWILVVKSFKLIHIFVFQKSSWLNPNLIDWIWWLNIQLLVLHGHHRDVMSHLIDWIKSYKLNSLFFKFV